MKEAQRRFITRLVIGLVLVLLPYLIKFLITLSGVLIGNGVSGDDVFCNLF